MRQDPVRNPYTPGAGQKPATVIGRDEELNRFGTTLTRLELGRAAQCPLIVGRRGVGKTVLLGEFSRRAAARDWVVVEHELTASGDLFATLTRLAREALLQIAPRSQWKRAAEKVGRILRGLEVSYAIAGLGFALSVPDDDAEPASMDPARDLTALFVALGEAARQHEKGVAVLMDEVQFAPEVPLGALIGAMHRVAQRELPITLVAAGLPQTRGVLAEAASYAERMFDAVEVGPLTADDAARAVEEPAAQEGVEYERGAIDEILRFTEGYPFFLQAFGDHLWRHAEHHPISIDDTRIVEPLVRESLDRGFFTFRTDKLPAGQRRYLRAMAELGSGEVASGEVASVLGMRSSAQTGQIRDALIRKGLIYSPRLGYAAFAVPQFDGYLKRHFELERHQPRTSHGPSSIGAAE